MKNEKVTLCFLAIFHVDFIYTGYNGITVDKGGGSAMHWIHWLVTLFFSGTAVSLLSYQAFEIVQAIVDWFVDRHS
jgi:hypothetical protein